MHGESMSEGEGGFSVNCNAASWGGGDGRGGGLERGEIVGKCAGSFSIRGVDGGVKVGVDDIGEGGRGGVASHGGRRSRRCPLGAAAVQACIQAWPHD